MYQSQNSSQIKSNILETAIPSSNASILAVTSLTVSLSFDKIHLSTGSKSFSSGLTMSLPSIFIMMNLDAFHTLLAKLRLFSTLSQ